MATSNPHLKPLQGNPLSAQAAKPSASLPTDPMQKSDDSRAPRDPLLPSTLPALPAMSMPRGGGSIRGMGEKFSVNPSSGTGTTSLPIQVSSARGSVQPTLSLGYNSASGNGPFGLGWQLSVPQISRKTEKGLPRYVDNGSDADGDVFVLSGIEDLVPLFERNSNGAVVVDANGNPIINDSLQDGYLVRTYSPRIEGSFSRIERWTNASNFDDVYWRTITRKNHTSIYGNTTSSRILDPNSPPGRLCIFSWLISETYDASGNAMIFNYKAEDSVNVPVWMANEANRTDTTRRANRYIRSIQYGNLTPNRELLSWTPFSALTLPQSDWRFTIVFDYGEYDSSFPLPTDDGAWNCRMDPFSTYRAGFEIRTYRLCHRVLMFHTFAELGTNSVLVKSTNLTYDQNKTATYLVSADQTGYSLNSARTAYISKSLPPVEFEYSLFPTDAALAQLGVSEIDAASLANLPEGLDGSKYQFVDLNSEGISGILTEQCGNWFYKRNLSANNVITTASGIANQCQAQVEFGSLEIVSARPSISLGGATGHFGDVDGAGKLELIELTTCSWGFYERENKEWLPLQRFLTFPNLDPSDPNVKWVDLTGNGIADILVYDDRIYTWYPSLLREGYGPGQTVTQPFDEKLGPVCVFGDAEETIHLADMSGDGLSDILRIRNGDICYWPNLGYGRFGSLIRMDNAPWFDDPWIFNEKRVLLADIDGSGTTDLLYAGAQGVDIYLNLSGNCFADRKRLSFSPPIDDDCSLRTLDLLGNGTSCLVWSTSLPDATPVMRYVDFMQATKPYLLVKVVNNLGVESRVQYAPSTKFYLQDVENGTPWVTRLPFPVQCVERLEVIDHVTGNRFVSRYHFRHGFYDGLEREFRGFGMVEQWDAEHYVAMRTPDDATANTTWQVPPVHTKTWIHTGAYLESEAISRSIACEFYGAPPGGPSAAMDTFYASLLSTTMPSDVDVFVVREACRALKGQVLRVEVYGDDGSPKANNPYSIAENNFTITVLQPFQDAHYHSIVMINPQETLSFNYERNGNDPRIGHQITLEINQFGDPMKTLSIAYGRSPGLSTLGGVDKAKQETTLLTYTETDYTNEVYTVNDYHTPVPCESRQYQLSGLTLPTGATRYTYNGLIFGNFAAFTSLTTIPFEEDINPSSKQKRLIGRSRSYWRADNLTSLLPAGQLQPLAIPGIMYTLCLTQGLIGQMYQGQLAGQPSQTLMPNPQKFFLGIGQQQAAYVDVDSDGNFWKPSGRMYFDTKPQVPASTELALAQSSFFMPRLYVDQFGNNTTVDYDSYFMFPVSQTNALGSTLVVDMDYRVLSPKLLTDVNGNRNAVAYDALGVVVGTALSGKMTENLGDSLTDFQTDLTQDQIDAFYNDPKGPITATLLGNATTRTVYDISQFYKDPTGNLPCYVANIVRETHSADSVPPQGEKFQVSFSYFDGLQRIIQNKVQAKPGPVTDGGPVIPVRWVGTGWTIFNNKGSPVQQFEPFFDSSPAFSGNMKIGVSSTIMYDSLGRAVAKLFPDHTLEKTLYSAWSSVSYDPNDNVSLSDPRTDPDIGSFFESLPQYEFLPSWADSRSSGQLGPDEQSAVGRTLPHANTPITVHFDVLGRAILKIMDCGSNGLFMTRSTLDIQGNRLETIDPLNRVALRTDFDMCGTGIHTASMDSAERWIVTDVIDKPLFAWSSKGYCDRVEYDVLRRPTNSFWSDQNQAEIMVQTIVYGESLPNSQALNLVGKVASIKDQAGISSTDAFDFKGNPLKTSRQFALNYKTTLDWTKDAQLIADVYTTTTSFDALNRPIIIITPDNSATYHLYNETSRLDQVFVNLKGENTSTDFSTWTPFITGIDCNAKSQTIQTNHGNGATITQTYDPLMFRLLRIQTTRPSSAGQGPLQDLSYVYDPIGNATTVRDNALGSIYFRNTIVDPTNDYTYDPVYRLTQATGREHLGQLQAPVPPTATDSNDVSLDAPGDGNAMARYIESYSYDAADNITTIKHAGTDATKPGWTRTFLYGAPTAIPPGDPDSTSVAGNTNNRLTSTSVSGATEFYKYDLHGNLTSMPQLKSTTWDYLDQLQSSSSQIVSGNSIPETTYYVYDSSGKRIRKVTERQTAGGQQPTALRERLYIGTFQVYREYAGDGSTISLERESLDVIGDNGRTAMVETRTINSSPSPSTPAQLTRYQYTNFVGSAVLELDDEAQVISYEEYLPYGSTSYQAVSSETDVPKRYRFTGQERDEESGLYYQGARYYAPWIGRWISSDPIGIGDNLNLYSYVSCRPTNLTDPTGTQGDNPTPTPTQWASSSNRDNIRVTTDFWVHIDEWFPVGRPGLSDADSRSRATDVDNRSLLIGVDNNIKGASEPMKPLPSQGAPVSVVKDPHALVTRKFSEVTEMREIFADAVSRIRNPDAMKPTKLKAAINKNVWDIVRNGQSTAAVNVRAALDKIGMEYVPGKGYRVKNSPRPQPNEPKPSDPKTSEHNEPTKPKDPTEPIEEGGGKAGKVFTAAAALDVGNKLYKGDVKGAAVSAGTTGGIILASEAVPGVGEAVMIYSVATADDDEIESNANETQLEVELETGSETLGELAGGMSRLGGMVEKGLLDPVWNAIKGYEGEAY